MQNSTVDSLVGDIVPVIVHSFSQAPRPVLANGTRWGERGRYIIERLLGRGGMGTVYLASDTLLGRQVALKVLNGGSGDAERARLLREARMAAGLGHERVARVYDVAEHDGSTFVAMEYVRGVSLRVWMSDVHQPAQVFGLLLQIADGLRVLHANRVMHRDLKPENVMLQADGSVKLVDFGLAGQFTPFAETLDADGATSTGEKSVLAFRGTPGYMAPEQYAGERGDARTDVFALGVLIYELVTRARPFSGTTAADLLHPPAFAEPAWQGFPGLAAVVARMLCTEEAQRFADGGEVLAALEPLAPGRRSRVAKWWPVACGVVVVLVAADVVAKPHIAKAIVPSAPAPDVTLSLASEGCAGGARDGLSLAAHPDVAACRGTWTGDVTRAQQICTAGWHVCNGSEPALTELTFDEATAVSGCFAIDAAQDYDVCRPGCDAAVRAGVDSAANIDMGAIGSGCPFLLRSHRSCLQNGGRIDASENSGTGCNWYPELTGVVCCKGSALEIAASTGA